MAKPRWMDMNTRLIITIGLVGAIVVFGIVLPGIKALLAVVETRTQQRTVIEAPIVEYNEHLAGEQASISEYAWVDEQRRIVRIPIDEAMRLYAQRAGKRQ